MPEAVVVGTMFGAICVVIMLVVSRLLSFGKRLDGLARLEAKVDALLQHHGVGYDPVGEVPPEVREALERGETIEAIRRVRQAKNMDLKSAKDYVDELRSRQGGAR